MALGVGVVAALGVGVIVRFGDDLGVIDGAGRGRGVSAGVGGTVTEGSGVGVALVSGDAVGVGEEVGAAFFFVVVDVFFLCFGVGDGLAVKKSLKLLAERFVFLSTARFHKPRRPNRNHDHEPQQRLHVSAD